MFFDRSHFLCVSIFVCSIILCYFSVLSFRLYFLAISSFKSFLALLMMHYLTFLRRNNTVIKFQTEGYIKSLHRNYVCFCTSILLSKTITMSNAFYIVFNVAYPNRYKDNNSL